MPDVPSRVMDRAALRHGAISMEELRAAGLGRGVVEHWLRVGWLRRLFRGVYLLGPVAGPLAPEHGALLSCGRHAVVSHRSAAVVWGLLRAAAGAVDVTVTGGRRRSRPGIAVHHAALTPADVRRRDALRLTSPARTLLDLAGTLPAHELELAINEAQVLGLVRPSQLRGLLTRTAPARPRGATALRTLLTDAPAPTRSELERRMRALARRVGLPLPRTQACVLRYTVDFLWAAERVVVEVDGYRAHGTRLRFETDRERDAALLAAGYRVLRFTWRQLVEQPEVVAARLAVVLAQR
jgi:very-short-patch-repair endonuclease